MTKLSLAYSTTEAYWQEKKEFHCGSWGKFWIMKIKIFMNSLVQKSVSSLLYKKRSLCGNITFIKQILGFNMIILTKVFYLLRTHKIFSPLSEHICPLPSGDILVVNIFFKIWKAFRHSITLKIKHLTPDSWFKFLSLEYCTFSFEVSQFLFAF